MAILPVHPRRGEMNQAGLEGRKKDSSGRSPEIRETMNESPERAKDTGKFLLFRLCRGSCYGDCPAPGSRPEHLSNGLSGLHSKSCDLKVTRTPDYTLGNRPAVRAHKSIAIPIPIYYCLFFPLARILPTTHCQLINLTIDANIARRGNPGADPCRIPGIKKLKVILSVIAGFDG